MALTVVWIKVVMINTKLCFNGPTETQNSEILIEGTGSILLSNFSLKMFRVFLQNNYGRIRLVTRFYTKGYMVTVLSQRPFYQ